MAYVRGLPERLISTEDQHEWEFYRDGLRGCPLTTRFLGEYLRSLVEQDRDHTPLQVPWIRSLFEFDLEPLEERIEQMVSRVGEETFSILIDDLFLSSSPITEHSRQVNSFFAEWVAYTLLATEAKIVRKTTARGDWIANGVLVSVKSILAPDYNYERLRSLFEGLALVKEYETLRGWHHVGIKELIRPDYRFMRHLMTFVEDELEHWLADFDAMEAGCTWERHRREQRAYTDSKGRSVGKLSVELSGNRNELQLRLDAVGHELESAAMSGVVLVFKRADPSYISIGTDMDTWWGKPDANRGLLGRWITEQMEKIHKAFAALDGALCRAWIDVACHPQHETAIAFHRGQYENFLASILGEHHFPVTVVFRGGLELAQPLVLDFPKVQPR